MILTRSILPTIPDFDLIEIAYGTEGNDFLSLNAGDGFAYGYGGNDVFIDAVSGDDAMYGGTGDDTFFGGTGDDLLDGGEGSDTVNYGQAPLLVAVDLEAGFALAMGIDTLVSIENVVGGLGNDSILGSAADNDLLGNDGNDTLDGRAGSDTLLGHAGNDKLIGGLGIDVLNGGQGDDTLTGGPGFTPDRFEFGAFNPHQRGIGFDTITDFQQGRDKIDVNIIDANSKVVGNQAFTFDATPDSPFEEFLDNVEGDEFDKVNAGPGPTINAERGEIEFRHKDGFTYVYLGSHDGDTGASLRLHGMFNLTASDFIL